MNEINSQPRKQRNEFSIGIKEKVNKSAVNNIKPLVNKQ